MQCIKRLSIKTLFLIFTFLSPASAQQPSLLASLEKEVLTLVERVKPSVVTVSAAHSVALKQQMSSDSSQFIMTNIGSGIVIDSVHILTRASIVTGSRDINVTLFDGTEYHGRFVGSEPDFGFALIKIEAPKAKLSPARIGDSERLRAGCWVTIMGNSIGISPAVAMGVINGTRSDGLLQISTEVTAGSVGGPVFNTKGQLVGILAAKISTINKDNLMNFPVLGSGGALAFPASIVEQKARDIMNGTISRRAWMGVKAADMPEHPGWVVLHEVTDNSPASKAGLHKGDILIRANEQTIDNVLQLATLIQSHQPDDSIVFQYHRADMDSVHTTRVTLQAQPSSKSSSVKSSVYPQAFTAQHHVKLSRDRTSPSISKDQLYKEWILQRIERLENELSSLRSMIQ
jgi:serine protease Do